MSRSVRNADGEMEVKPGRRTRSIINSETIDSPLRRSSRVKFAGKQNESSPESPLSDSSNANSISSVRNTRRRVDALNNSALTERSRTLRSRRNSGFDEQTNKQLTRAGSESKSPPTTARPTRKTRASSMEPAANIENNDMKTSNSELLHTPINSRKRRSILLTGKPVIEENEEMMIPVVALDRVLPNLKEIKETCSESVTIKDMNESMPVSKNANNSVCESTCKEESDTDINDKKEHSSFAENSPMKAVEEVKMDASINKLIVSDNGERSINDSINSTQMESSIEDVPTIQSQISTETIPRKLGLKNASYTKNSIKEEDELLGDKENQEVNIIDNSKNTDVTISNVLQSPNISVNNLFVGKSVKVKDENAASSDNMQNVMETDTDSLSETPLNESIDEKTSYIEVCEDSSLDGNIQILKCPENVNDINLLSPYSDKEHQNTSSADIHVDSNKDGEIGADKSLRLEDSMEEQLQHITSEDENINNDKKVGMPVTPKAHANTEKEESKDVCLTPIELASDKCEAKEETGSSNISKNLIDADTRCSILSDISTEKTSTPLLLLTNESTKNDSPDTEMVAEIPSQENIGKKPSDVDMKLTDFETTSEVIKEDNITNETENDKTSINAEPIDKELEKNDKAQNVSKLDDSLASERKSISDSNTQNKVEESEITKQFERQDEKLKDDDPSDANISTNLFKDIPADEWKEKTCDVNSVHSMSTDRLENGSENECDDFVLVVKEASQTPEDKNIEKEKRALNYNSDDTILLKTQRDKFKQKIEEDLTVSEVQCEMNKNKLDELINTRKSIQQEEINEANCETNDLEVESQNRKEPMQNQAGDTQNVSKKNPRTSDVCNQFTPASNTSIGESVDVNLTTKTDQNLNRSYRESPLNKRNSRNKLYESLSNKPKSVEKVDDEVEKFSEAETVEEKESLNKSPIGSPSSASDSSKSNDSMDTDIEREYNLHGVEVSKFSNDDVPGDECRASETESSDPDDHGSDLADFVVNDDDDDDDDMSEEEIETSEIDKELYNAQDDDNKKSNENTIDEQCPRMQDQDDSEEEEIEKEEQKRTDTSSFRKGERKCIKSKELGLPKINSNDRKMAKSEIESSKKKKRKNKIESSDDEIYNGNEEKNGCNKKLHSRNIVHANETDKKVENKQFEKVELSEIKGRVTKKKQGKVGTKKKVEVIQNKSADTTEERSSKFGETIQLDLSENGKNVKRKSEIEIVTRKIKKNKVKDDDERIQKENAIHTSKNQSEKCSTVELSRKGIKRLSNDIIENLSDVPVKVLKKSELQKLPSRLMPDSLLKKNKINVKQHFIPLSSYGSTSNFYVSNIQKIKKVTSEVQSFKQKMLNRNPRQPFSCYSIFLEKQKASNKR